MAKKDTVSISEEYQCIKEAQCQWCGTKFQYPYQTSISGTGLTEAQAKQDAANKAQSELESELGSERCPTCGALQASMQASSHALGHGCAMWFAGIVFVICILIAGLLSLNLVSFISLPVLSYCALAGLLIAVAYNIWVVQRNENSNLEAGLAEARKSVAEHKITILSQNKGIATPASIPPSIGFVEYLAIGLSVLGIGLLQSGEILRIASGWHSNGVLFPPVAGPGDEVTVYWPESLSCLKGKWKGNVTAELVDTNNPQLKSPIEATCAKEDWGGFIGGKGTRNRSTLIWMKVKIPDDPKLTGQIIRLPAKISVTYPHSTGLLGFENREADFSHEFELHLSSPNAASTYTISWWFGFIVGGGLIVLSALVLCRIQLDRLKTSPHPKTLKIEKVADAQKKPGEADRSHKKAKNDQDDDLEFVN